MTQDLKAYLRENARHGTAEFPLGFYHCQVPGDFVDLLIHWHEEIEITLVREGELLYSIGLQDTRVKAGDILLIGSNTLHSAHKLPEATAVTDTVVFHLSMLGLNAGDDCARRYLEPLQSGAVTLPSILHPGEGCYDELLACFDALWSCREGEVPHRILLIKSELFRLVQLLWRSAATEGSEQSGMAPSQYEEKLKTVLSYVQAHYNEPITVGELADLCGFSQVHFMNIFKKAMGVSCMEYLIEYRLTKAAFDLQENNEPILQVAMNNGFQNISYFNRMFKKRYRMTPSRYRRGHAEGMESYKT